MAYKKYRLVLKQERGNLVTCGNFWAKIDSGNRVTTRIRVSVERQQRRCRSTLFLKLGSDF